MWVPFFEKLSIIRKIIYYFRGYKILQLKKTNKKEKLKIYIEKINFSKLIYYIILNVYNKIKVYVL